MSQDDPSALLRTGRFGARPRTRARHPREARVSMYPFSAVVGADDMTLALILSSISPQIGGVLVRGEKGTAKSTAVRGLAELLSQQDVVAECRFGCDPSGSDGACPDGPHQADAQVRRRPARLVELPVGATEDRVVGSLDLERALGEGRTSFEPGLLAAAHRGILYVDEVNLLHDHLVDLLLDAAAMGRCTVERDGVSLSHPARIVLIGTMNPEEGELRPQLLDRFGLTAQVAAPRDPQLRAEVVRRRMAYDADPESFTTAYAQEQESLRDRIEAARVAVSGVRLGDRALATIAHVCAGLEVDGMRADLVTARAAIAHAAWCGRPEVVREDIRAAARLALPHRRRRNPFDAPGLDEDLLDRLLDEADPEHPDPDDGGDDPQQPQQHAEDDKPSESTSPQGRSEGPAGENGRPEPERAPNAATPDSPRPETADQGPDAPGPRGGTDGPGQPEQGRSEQGRLEQGAAEPDPPYRARLMAARGTGSGPAGRRSRAHTGVGKVVGVDPAGPGGRRGRGPSGPVHLLATIRNAAPHQARRGRTVGAPLALRPGDLRRSRIQGRESNLVLLAVDASGSMAARRRMSAVKGAVLALLMDAYQRRDKVGLITFRGRDAELVLPPTSSVDTAARRLTELPHGGRTPLAEGLTEAACTVQRERLRDPQRRPLLVVVTDGRATSGPGAAADAYAVADRLRGAGVESVVVDCESGRVRLGLARTLATRMGAQYLQLEQVAATELVGIVQAHTRDGHGVRRIGRGQEEAA